MDSDCVSGHYMNESLVKTIHDCEATCIHMNHHLIMMEEDLKCRSVQIILLRDCADICSLTARYVACNTFFARNAAALCADICEACGCECAKFPDQMSQNCAQVCFNCARHCRMFASMGMGMHK
jgi:hypothetical protein